MTQNINLQVSMWYVTEHAQTFMKRIGITYQHCTPQSMFDCWQFWNCENIPDELPEGVTIIDADPECFIGHGLSQEDVFKIKNYKP